MSTNWYNSRTKSIMHRSNVLILENNLSAVSAISMLIQKSGLNVMAVLDNTDDAFDAILNTFPDLIFMNIDIKGKRSSLELIRHIRSMHIPLIHIPAFHTEEKEENSLQVTALNALAKPHNQLMWESYINIALHTANNRNRNGHQDMHSAPDHKHQDWSDCTLKDSIFLKKGNFLCKICFKDILYIKAEGNYCEFQTTDEKFIHKITLTSLINMLPKRYFLKIHRSYIVHLHHIKRLSLSENELSAGNFSIPIGRAYKTELLNQLPRIEVN